MTTTLTALDWPTLLATPDTRWYLDRHDWDWVGQCGWQIDCSGAVVAHVEYMVAALPGDPYDDGWNPDELVCSHHLADLIEHALEDLIVLDTVVEVGVDPALLRLTGVDPAVVARFNDGAMGCAA